MSDQRNDIIEKVQKLLALATSSPNEHEAKLAASKAHSMLAKYNLTLEQVEESKIAEEYTAIDKSPRGSRPMEDRYILALLQEYFFVKVVTQRFYQRREELFQRTGMASYQKRYKCTLIGRNHNVAIARYVYDFLFRAFRSSFAAYCKANGQSASSARAKLRHGYYAGLFHGLSKQLEESQQTALAAAQQLVVAEDPNVEKFMEQAFPDLKKGKSQAPINADQEALKAGYAEGQKMKIAMGITGSTEQQPQIGQVLGLEHKP